MLARKFETTYTDGVLTIQTQQTGFFGRRSDILVLLFVAAFIVAVLRQIIGLYFFTSFARRHHDDSLAYVLAFQIVIVLYPAYFGEWKIVCDSPNDEYRINGASPQKLSDVTGVRVAGSQRAIWTRLFGVRRLVFDMKSKNLVADTNSEKPVTVMYTLARGAQETEALEELARRINAALAEVPRPARRDHYAIWSWEEGRDVPA